MINCQKAEELMSLMVDGMLTQAEKDELREHVKGCEKCRRLLQVYSQMSLVMAQHEKPPEELVTGVMAGVSRINKQRSDSKRKVRMRIIGGVATAAGLALVIFAGSKILPGLRGGDLANAPNAADNITESETALFSMKASEDGTQEAMDFLTGTDGAMPAANGAEYAPPEADPASAVGPSAAAEPAPGGMVPGNADPGNSDPGEPVGNSLPPTANSPVPDPDPTAPEPAENPGEATVPGAEIKRGNGSSLWDPKTGNEYSPSTLMVFYAEGKKEEVRKIFEAQELEVIYEYSLMNGFAVRLPQPAQSYEELEKARQKLESASDAILAVNLDQVMHLVEPVRPAQSVE